MPGSLRCTLVRQFRCLIQVKGDYVAKWPYPWRVTPDKSLKAAAGFWSYAHQDDDAERGGVLALARSLAQEYALLTGDEFDLFVDRSSIEWGDLWRTRIAGALVNTTFFLPIVTPRYFRRPECRKELQTFYSQATSLGVSEYLLPILYVPVLDLDEDSPDEAVAIVARTQYVDWTTLRLAGPESAEYRTAVNELASRLVGIASALAARATTSPTGVLASDEPRTLDLLAKVRELWPELVDVVEMDRQAEAQWQGNFRAHDERLHRLQRSGRGGARIPLMMKLGEDSIPLAEKHYELARRFSALAIELDPYIVALFRLSNEGAEEISDLLDELRADISDICERISKLPEDNPRMDEYADQAKAWARVSKLFEESSGFAGEADALVLSWYRRAFGREFPSTPAWMNRIYADYFAQSDGEA